jgi:hypothetical protein
MITMENGKPVSYDKLDNESFEFIKINEDEGLLKRLDTTTPEFKIDEASVIVTSEGRNLRLPKGSPVFDKPFADGWPRSHREVESERMLANIHGTFYEVPLEIVRKPATYYRMKPVCSHNKQIMDYCTWRGLLVLSGVKADAPASNNVFRSGDGKKALWTGGIDDLWQLGKAVGHGGPWKNTAVKAGIPSDQYLMNGYDRKTLTLKSGFHKYKTFQMKAGTEQTWKFPDGFAAHWIRFSTDKDCSATAWLDYE